MNYRICPHPQGSPEWLADRLGCVTGSDAGILYAKGRGSEESVQRVNYRYDLAEQRVTGEVKPQGFVSDAMKWGTENEPFARMAYEGQTGLVVEESGFIRREDVHAGCSLDGMIREGGRIVGIQEYKCPMLKTHIAYIKAGVMPAEYQYQVLHNLWVTGADWCDFASFRPGFRLFTIRVHAKDSPLEEHDRKVRQFLSEVAECEAEIRSYAE